MTDPQTAAEAADAAAARVQAVLDARPQDDRPAGHILYTLPGPDRTRERWLHLTEPDLRALLAERRELTSLLEQALIDLRHARNQRSDVWLAERLEVLRDATLEAAGLLDQFVRDGDCKLTREGCWWHNGKPVWPCPHSLGRRFVETWGTQASAADGPDREGAQKGPESHGDAISSAARPPG